MNHRNGDFPSTDFINKFSLSYQEWLFLFFFLNSQIPGWLKRILAGSLYNVYEPNDAEINPIWHGGGGAFLSACPNWIRFCKLITKIPKIFEGKNLHQSGYFDILPSSLSLIKVVPWRP